MKDIDTIQLTRKICDDFELFLSMKTQAERREFFKDAVALVSKQYDLEPHELHRAIEGEQLDQKLKHSFQNVESLAQKADSETGTYEDAGEAVGGVIGAAAGAGMGGIVGAAIGAGVGNIIGGAIGSQISRGSGGGGGGGGGSPLDDDWWVLLN